MVAKLHFKGYEETQLQAIRHWLRTDSGGLPQVTQSVANAVAAQISQRLPAEGVALLHCTCDRLLRDSEQEWSRLKVLLPEGLAGVSHWQDLEQQPLEVCDRLQTRVQALALGKAALEGLLTAPLEGLGELADVGLALLLGLRTIQRVGLCYGFGSDSPREKQLLWGTFATSFATTAVERRHTLLSLLQRDTSPDRGAIAELLEDTALETLTDTTVEAVLERAILSLSEELSGELIPLVGIALGVMANEQFASQVATTARYVYQLRWLLRAYGARGTERAVN